jgi:hypothetical protein
MYIYKLFLLRNYEQAVKLMQKATVMPPRKVAYHDETETVQMRLYKSLKLWSLYADLEESFGTFKVMEVCHVSGDVTVTIFHSFKLHTVLSK